MASQDSRFSCREAEEIGVGVPANIAKFLFSHYANLQANICHTDCLNGYGSKLSKTIHVSMYYEKCNNCDFHSLWNPDPKNSNCRRHTYGRKGYEDVFVWSPNSGIALEDAFDCFLKQNPRIDIAPVVKVVIISPSDVKKMCALEGVSP